MLESPRIVGGCSIEEQKELVGLMSSGAEAGKQRMVKMAAEQGMTITVDEVRGFLSTMDEEDEFNDIELDAVVPLPLLVELLN